MPEYSSWIRKNSAVLPACTAEFLRIQLRSEEHRLRSMAIPPEGGITNMQLDWVISPFQKLDKASKLGIVEGCGSDWKRLLPGHGAFVARVSNPVLDRSCTLLSRV